jgi:hypothetical protein
VSSKPDGVRAHDTDKLAADIRGLIQERGAHAIRGGGQRSVTVTPVPLARATTRIAWTLAHLVRDRLCGLSSIFETARSRR